MLIRKIREKPMNGTKTLALLVRIILLTMTFAACSKSEQPETVPTSLFKFIQTVHVTPDSNYLGGVFARINFVPATNRFVVTFAATLVNPPSSQYLRGGYAYKVYTTEMQETGETGLYSSEYGDSGSRMVDNTYYFVTPEFKPFGWHVTKFDAANWTKLAETHMYFKPQEDSDKYPNNDPMVAFVNGQLDVSAQYNASGAPPALTGGAGTFHDFFSPDLVFLGQRNLTDTPQIHGSSLIYLDGVYYFITANAYLGGDMVVATYDLNWKFLDVKTLKHNAFFSTGLAYDGQRFYVAYLDNSQTVSSNQLPVYLNVRLAAFDRDWNLSEDIAITNYAIADNIQTGRPWVILHGNRLYVSFDLDTVDPVTRTESKNWQALVSVFELTQST